MDTKDNTISDIAALVKKSLDPFFINNVPHVLVPHDMRLVELQNILNTPNRIDERVTLTTPSSFLRYYNAFCDERSVVFCNKEDALFKAVLDWHRSPKIPAWGTHQAVYGMPKTPEWASWEIKNGVRMNQDAFALFIEQNHDEIVSPAGAQMLEIAESLRAHQNVDFSRAINLSNGQIQLNYNETIDGKAGKSGQLEIPQKIKIGVQLFNDGDAYAVEAHFRYRITNGVLQMWYDLIRPHKAHQKAVEDIVETIRSGMNQGAFYFAE